MTAPTATGTTTRTNSGAKTRKLSGATVGIPPRQVDFHFPEESPRYLYDNNATATMFMAVLSGIFPPGERFFVESVRHYRDRIGDEKLKAAVSGFIGQEALHGREHDRLNAFFAARGIDTGIPERAVKFSLGLLARLPARYQLACTSAMEHFTAALAEQLLEDQQFCQGFDQDMLKLWQWHALEELEHKAVTYDVLDLAGNQRLERALALVLVVAAIAPGMFLSWGRLLAREGKLTDRRDIARGLGLLLGRRGFLIKPLADMPQFIQRRFHPNQHDTRAMESKWRERLFGAEGSLRTEWKNSEALQ